MKEPLQKRFTVFVSVEGQEYLNVSRCETIQEVNEIISKAKHTAVGYAVFDREKGELVRKKNLF